MRKKPIALSTIFIALFLSGCDSHDSDWFKKHPTERKEKMQHCSNLSAEKYEQDYECGAAELATKQDSDDILNSMEKKSKGL